VYGNYDIGGLVGHSDWGFIRDSYATGSVGGPGDRMGGLVGTSTANSPIQSSYATGLVTARDVFGGLIGSWESRAPLGSAYWDSDASGRATFAGNDASTKGALTTAQAKEQGSYVGWDFTDVWGIDPAINQGYPYLRATVGGACCVVSGDGSAPIAVSSWTDLHNIRNNLAARYVLTKNLNPSDADYNTYASSTANGGAGWLPIGNLAAPFMGEFDGGGYVIRGLTINRSVTDYVGLFGVARAATFRRIGFSALGVTGGGYTGGLVGQAVQSTQLADVEANGNVTGSNGSFVGGVAGSLVGSRAERIRSSGSVNGVYQIGGLVG